MEHKLNEKQEQEFEKLVQKMQNKINLALYKCNIERKYYADFYSYALEGLLVSYLMLQKGVIEEDDFEKFSFTTMKRKIIDEIRRRNKFKPIYFDNIENTKLLINKDYDMVKIDFYQSLTKMLSKEELKILKLIIKGQSYNDIFEKMNISKSKGYVLINSIKNKCTALVYNF